MAMALAARFLWSMVLPKDLQGSAEDLEEVHIYQGETMEAANG